MKTLKKLFYLSILTGLFFTSCSNDDDNTVGPTPGPLNGTVLSSGTITESVTLDASQSYTIDGSFLVGNGATLTIPAGTIITSEVGVSNYIAVLKGGSIDIQGTPTNPVIMQSNGTAGSWGGLVICGDATTTEGTNAIAEVGGLLYGGSNDADDSGDIDYLIIRDAGAQINSDSQFNGLTLYAVGSGTNISNVAIINGTDDGVEFFGGSVNATNMYLENNEDDAVDWTEGWNGTLTNAYVINNIAGFSTAIEADGVNNNPTLVNFTAISSTGGTAIQIKNNSGATINGLSLTGFETSFDFRDAAPVSNLQIDGSDADIADDAVFVTSSTNASLFAWVTAASTISGNVLPANISGNVTLDASIEYSVSGPVLINNNATLTIPAGTVIVSQSGTANYIAVLKGGNINIEGTANNPVEMRSVDGEAWGGLLICGDATTTEGINAIAEVGGLVYGGSNDADDSGNIDYLILRNTGAQINADSQFNGLSLYAVGSMTTIDNVAVIEGADDGVEFYGGTVSVTNFYAENIEDDSIDWTEGWNGTLTNTFVKLTISGFSTAIEADGVNNNPTLVNFTAVSSGGGTGIQIKNNSGATINGLSLSGFSSQFDFRDNAPASNLVVDSVNAAEATTYSSSTTVESDFSWINN
ncbi:beta strand repeat-containing protein [Hyunsoonleella sp. 2307UL5-6]|uniref:beta strand repeat-containing protein n=1 Tax=Hyunsoonleella sp. 2307UL5-6 TaxID=3384768 RepID=UPI0039BC6CE5